MQKDISLEGFENKTTAQLKGFSTVNSKCKIEDVLSSKGRVLILKLLAERDELNISAIARITNLNHRTTAQHLEFLTKAGLVQEKRFGRIKIFRYRLENSKARSLKRLFEIWD